MMKRITPLNVVAGLAVAGLLAATVLFSVGAEATPKRVAAHTTSFRQALAAKLGAQLHKPADQMLAALKAARQGSTTKADRRARRASRLAARAKALRSGGRPNRAQRLARIHQRRAQWATAVAGSLGVNPDALTAALRALVAERLDSLVTQGWLTADRRTALLACFDDTAQCGRGTRPPGLAFLRQGL
jgi:hypothetical protein